MVKWLAVFTVLFAALPASAQEAQNAYDFTFTNLDDGQPLPMSTFKGKVVLVVNTASQCGFTPQYEGLQALYDTYADRGLVVFGVPSNDFGRQEPGSSTQIKDFCETTFQVTFPMSEKEVVSGDGAHPFYKWARNELGMLAAPKWNFHKYLVSRDGKLLDWFATTTKPRDADVIKAVEAALR